MDVAARIEAEHFEQAVSVLGRYLSDEISADEATALLPEDPDSTLDMRALLDGAVTAAGMAPTAREIEASDDQIDVIADSANSSDLAVASRMIAIKVGIESLAHEMGLAGSGPLDLDEAANAIISRADEWLTSEREPTEIEQVAEAKARTEVATLYGTYADSPSDRFVSVAAFLRQGGVTARELIVRHAGPVMRAPARRGQTHRRRTTRPPADRAHDGNGDEPGRTAESGDTSCLAAALEYLQAGFLVLPLNGKEPHARLIRSTHNDPSTKHLVEQGVTEDHVRRWFSDPSVNVGVFCGEESGGLVVVDLDEPEISPPGFDLPPTPTVQTSRGHHFYYRSAAPVRPRKGRGWDLQAKGPQYVVAPPSVHPDTGSRYQWQVPLDQEPLADFSRVVIPEPVVKSGRSYTPNAQIRPTKDVLLGTRTTRDKRPDDWLKAFDGDTAAVEAMARALGIDAPLGQPFCCVIHPEKHASASLKRAEETGHWLYHDFHGPARGDHKWLTLPQVRAVRSGRKLPLSGPEHATWKLILLVEADVLQLVEVPSPALPPDLPGITQHVYKRFLYLLGCRWNYDHGEPVPFERKFAAALCNISERPARDAINELADLGAIVVAGYHGKRTRLWLPGSCSGDGQFVVAGEA